MKDEEKQVPEVKQPEETKQTGGEAEQENNLPKTQAELDALIEGRLARERKKYAQPPAPAAPTPAAPAQETPAPAASVVDTAQQDAALTALKREAMTAKAQLAAVKDGVKPSVVEDAVLLALHEAGDEADEAAVSEALKAVLKRHPEWKAEAEEKKTSGGFRIGADAPPADSPANPLAQRPASKKWNKYH